MILTGVVWASDQVSVPDSGADAWRVTVTPDQPTRECAFYVRRSGPRPAPGDRIETKLGGPVHLTRADGSTEKLGMLGYLFDPDAPFNPSGWRDPLTGAER